MMLSPFAIQLILRQLDCIDEYVALRLLRKRPWHEPALTMLLCDLLDEDVQEEEKLDYTTRQLNSDLHNADEPIYVSLDVETHQYTSGLERYVTQSDFGLIINHSNQFDHSKSWTRGWLVQAKRLIPSNQNPLNYDVNSRFASFDKSQHGRIGRLTDAVEADFIRYLFYCPRPSRLQPEVRAKLSYQRSNLLNNDIFDYALGLQLRDDLLSGSPTVAAGMFLTGTESPPKSLGEVHSSIFAGSTPFSWFILQHFCEIGGLAWHRRLSSLQDPDSSGSNLDNPVVNGIVRGDPSVIDMSLLPDLNRDDQSFTVLPKHTITIGLTVGVDLPNSNQ